MWIWVIIIAVIAGGIIGACSPDNEKEDALGGAMAGGCIAMGCLARIAITAVFIIGILWLAKMLFC